MNNNTKRAFVFDFLRQVGISVLNAHSVAHVTTNLTKATVYHVLRKRNFSHKKAIDFILTMTPRQESEITRLIMQNSNSRVRNAYFNSRKRGLNHDRAMNAALSVRINLL